MVCPSSKQPSRLRCTATFLNWDAQLPPCSVLGQPGLSTLSVEGSHNPCTLSVQGSHNPRAPLLRVCVCSGSAAMPSVFAACASLHAAGARCLELGGDGRGRASSRLLPRRQSRERSEKYPKVLRRARAKRKKKKTNGHNPPPLWALRVPTSPFQLHLRLQRVRLLRLLLGSLAVGSCSPCSHRRVPAHLLGAPCPTTTHTARLRHRRRPRTPLGHHRRARPGASAKRPGRCSGPRGARAPGAAAAQARGRRAWTPPRVRSPRGCPSARGAGTTATRRHSRATNASACGGNASARNAT